LWLVLLAVRSVLALTRPPAPWWAGVSLPTALLVGAVLVGALLALLSRSVGRTGAVQRRRRAESRLLNGVEQVADRSVLAPVEAELERHERARAALSRAAGE